MGLERGWAWTLLIVALMASVPWTPLLANDGQPPTLDDPIMEPRETVQITNQFATSNGFTHTNLTQSATTGLTQLSRPQVSWTATNGFGLMSARTGACSAYLPATNEVFLIGGRIDVDPAQTGDEANTDSVEIFDMVNKTWARPMSY